MIKYNLPDFSEINEVFFTTSTNLSLISINDKRLYHISEALLVVIVEILDRHGNASQNDKGGRHE
jgi:hypothetical protein